MRDQSKLQHLTIVALTFTFFICSVAAAAITKSGSFYSVKVQTSGSGYSRVAVITTTGKGGYHCNKLYPWKLTVTPGAGVTMAKTTFKRADAKRFSEAAVVFEVPYQTTTDAKTVSAALKLSLCDDKQCQMETVKLEWPAR